MFVILNKLITKLFKVKKKKRKIHKEEDYIGNKFGKWTILNFEERKNHQIIVRCRCECGNEQNVFLDNILRGLSNGCFSCGMKMHGCAKTRLYGIWKGMKRRCYNKNEKCYKYYGQRGIKMCKQWKNDFISFRDWAYENGYDENAKFGECTIDRIDVNGDYEPNNCRWATTTEQNINQRKRTTNTSGYVGVSFVKDRPNHWISSICINRKTYRLGSYKTKKEALDARNNYITKNNLSYKIQKYTGK